MYLIFQNFNILTPLLKIYGFIRDTYHSPSCLQDEIDVVSQLWTNVVKK